MEADSQHSSCCNESIGYVDYSQLKALILGHGCASKESLDEQSQSQSASPGKSRQLTQPSLQHEDLGASASDVRTTTSEAVTALHKHPTPGGPPGGLPDVSRGNSKPHASAESNANHQPTLSAPLPTSRKRKMTSSGSPVEDGDTQPLSPSVYAEHERRKRVKKDSWGDEQFDETNTTTPHTYHTGEPGHIDLLAAYDGRNVVHTQELEELPGDEAGATSQTDVRTEFYPESMRFQIPKTPATTRKKGDHRGEATSSVGRTPRLPINPFAGHVREDTGLMGLSQAFRATQAASSPNPNLILSDAPSERPSPAINNVSRPLTAGSHSSPAKMTRAGLQRTVPEPHAVYISMKESQEERDRRALLLRNSSAHQKSSSQDSSDDEDMASAEYRARRRIIQRNLEEEAARQFKAVTAQPRPDARKSGGRAANQASRGSSTELPGMKVGGSGTVIISDDPNVNEDNNTTEDETEHEDEPITPRVVSAHELVEDNKENFGVRNSRGSRPVLRGSRRNNSRTEDVGSSPAQQNRIGFTPINRELDELTADGDSDGEMTDRVQRLPRMTQTVAVADSQISEGLSKQHKTSLSRSALVSSSETRAFIPQSQSNQLPHTSQIDSDMARQILETPSLQPSRSSPLGHHAGESARKVPASSPPHVGSGSRPSTPTSARNVLVTKTIPTFNSSPPQVVRRAISPDIEKDDVALATESQPISHRASEPQTSHDNSTTSPRIITTDVRKEAFDYKVNHSREVHANGATPRIQSNTLPSTIPETSSVLRQNHESNSLLLASEKEKNTASARLLDTNTSSDARQEPQQSKPSTVFETAQTHATESPSKPRAYLVRQTSEKSKSPSQSRTSGPHLFRDIASNPSPSDGIGEVDLDIGLLTHEDLEFQTAIDGSSPIGPARKRRRGPDGRPLRVSVQGHSRHAKPPSSSNDRQTVVDEHTRTSVQSSSNAKVVRDKELDPRTSPNEEPEDPVLPNLVTAPATTTLADKTYEKPKGPRRKPQALHNRPNKEGAHENPGISNDLQDETRTDSDPAQTNLHSPTMNAPNRVFALFKGNQKGFYPATCLGVIYGTELRYKVRFDDGTIDVINAWGTKRLELRVGDNIKIDKPGLRNHPYVVKGFQDKEMGNVMPGVVTPSRTNGRNSSSSERIPPTDVFGHKSVMVVAKHSRSVSETVDMEAVAVADIYITQMMWSRFKDREFSYRPPLPTSISGLQTPSEQLSTPSTPSSRTRRCKSSGNPFSAPPRTVVSSASQLFKNMVFSITNIEDSNTRKQIAQHIQSHDGHLLGSSHGFEELFDVPDLEPATPYKQVSDDNIATFHLSSTAQHRGFTCLIADKHCRSAKYIQALALGIPCLATRWVTDCIRKERVIPWEPYLLPAGESTFLDGAVRSRHLPSSTPDSILLPAVVASRPNFLKNRSILLITGKGKEAEVMKNYPFIAYALGASRVCRAGNLEEAKKAVSEAKAAGEEWDWVYFYEDGRYDVRQAEGILFASGDDAQKEEKAKGDGAASSVGRPRKRKRASGGVGGSGNGSGENSKVVKRGKTRVVGTDFVVQSLILGMLIEDR